MSHLQVSNFENTHQISLKTTDCCVETQIGSPIQCGSSLLFYTALQCAPDGFYIGIYIEGRAGLKCWGGGGVESKVNLYAPILGFQPLSLV
ncbi:MAG: hypothetical protein K2X81_03110, partial [Candidatus Obscuribacterales bacterium]|nr:hypothetical protein [Candidatus Obscuribacterales bacterium]